MGQVLEPLLWSHLSPLELPLPLLPPSLAVQDLPARRTAFPTLSELSEPNGFEKMQMNIFKTLQQDIIKYSTV